MPASASLLQPDLGLEQKPLAHLGLKEIILHRILTLIYTLQYVDLFVKPNHLMLVFTYT